MTYNAKKFQVFIKFCVIIIWYNVCTLFGGPHVKTKSNISNLGSKADISLLTDAR